MEKQFEIIRKTRTFFTTLLDTLSLTQLNEVPAGFNNNIAWNFGHVIAAQQGVCYKRSGLEMIITDELYDQFKPDSRPTKPLTAADFDRLKGLLFSSIDDLEQDCAAGKFAGYKPWTTRYGVAINNIEDAIKFLSFHDGLHIGYSMALRRCVTKDS